MEMQHPDTRLRIMDAAAAIFAEHGFAATTIRMICGRAGVNLSAVNYHFGSKEGLYCETIRHLRKTAYERYPSPGGSPPAQGRRSSSSPISAPFCCAQRATKGTWCSASW